MLILLMQIHPLGWAEIKWYKAKAHFHHFQVSLHLLQAAQLHLD